MTAWIVATLAGIALAVVLYRAREPGALARLAPLVTLRALAMTLLAALLVDAPFGVRRLPSPMIALDASLSWARENDSTFWRSAAARARSLARDSLLLFGDSVRAADRGQPDEPSDLASHVRPLAERAQGTGRPLSIVTDGEIDDPGPLSALPSGSRVEVRERAARLDVAAVFIDSPRSVVGGDTVEIRTTIRNGALAAPQGSLSLLAAGRVLAILVTDSLAPRAERTQSFRIAATLPAGASVLSAVVSVNGDVERRNDTVSVVMEAGRAAAAVLVSSSPDFDSRFLMSVLRGAVELPTRAYFRIAPGSWRKDGSLASVEEAEVRRAAREAPLVIFHGDTAIFGSPRAAASGALALFAPPYDSDASSGEWFPIAAPPSPVSAALSGIAWDSLPPLEVARSVPPLGWDALVVARARQFERRSAIVGTAAGRRIVVIGASGFWRWQFRGGSGADAYSALWGSIFDWLTQERADDRVAIPIEAVLRSGDRVRWRRGSGRDSVVTAVVRRRDVKSGADSVRLRFGIGGSTAESPALLPGVYDVTVLGGSIVLAVNTPRELLPRAPTVKSGAIGGEPSAGERPRLRDNGWVYVVIILLLCAEWILRRKLGYR